MMEASGVGCMGNSGMAALTANGSMGRETGRRQRLGEATVKGEKEAVYGPKGSTAGCSGQPRRVREAMLGWAWSW